MNNWKDESKPLQEKENTKAKELSVARENPESCGGCLKTQHRYCAWMGVELEENSHLKPARSIHRKLNSEGLADIREEYEYCTTPAPLKVIDQSDLWRRWRVCQSPRRFVRSFKSKYTYLDPSICAPSRPSGINLTPVFLRLWHMGKKLIFVKSLPLLLNSFALRSIIRRCVILPPPRDGFRIVCTSFFVFIFLKFPAFLYIR